MSKSISEVESILRAALDAAVERGEPICRYGVHAAPGDCALHCWNNGNPYLDRIHGEFGWSYEDVGSFTSGWDGYEHEEGPIGIYELGKKLATEYVDGAKVAS